MTLVRRPYSDSTEVLEDLGARSGRRDLARPGALLGPAGLGTPGVQLREDGPLDMRFDPEAGRRGRPGQHLDEEELADLFFEYGEERHSRRVARRIVEARGSGRSRRPAGSPRSSAGASPASGGRSTRRPGSSRPCGSPSMTNSNGWTALGHCPTISSPGDGPPSSASIRWKIAGSSTRSATIQAERPDPETRHGVGRGTGHQPPSAKREIEGRRAMSQSGWTTGAAEPPTPGSVDEVRH